MHGVDQLRASVEVLVAITPGVFMSNFGRSFPEEVLRGIAIGAGLEPLQPDTDGKIDEATQAELQRRLEPMMGDPKHIADLVHYIISLPQSIQIEEVVIRPPKAMPIG